MDCGDGARDCAAASAVVAAVALVDASKTRAAAASQMSV
jgi:hypothetical protein